MDSLEERHFPVSAGILFGLGLGGFFDGIILHQVLRWHHMLSSWYPVNTIENFERAGSGILDKAISGVSA